MAFVSRFVLEVKWSVHSGTAPIVVLSSLLANLVLLATSGRNASLVCFSGFKSVDMASMMALEEHFFSARLE